MHKKSNYDRRGINRRKRYDKETTSKGEETNYCTQGKCSMCRDLPEVTIDVGVEFR